MKIYQKKFGILKVKIPITAMNLALVFKLTIKSSDRNSGYETVDIYRPSAPRGADCGIYSQIYEIIYLLNNAREQVF